MEPVRDLFGQLRSCDHQTERDDDEERQADGQGERGRFHLPPWSAFIDVVRLVQGVDDCVHAGRCAPDGAEHAEGQQAAVLVVRDLQHLILDDGDDFAGCDPRKCAGDRVEQAAYRDETDHRDQKEQRRKQREHEVVGQRGQAEAVVGDHLPPGLDQEILPTDWHSKHAQQTHGSVTDP